MHMSEIRREYAVLKGITLCVTFVLVSLFSLWVYSVPQEVTHSPTPNILHVSLHVKNYIARAIDRNSNLLAVQILSVDFQRNILIETYADISNPILREFYNTFINNMVLETPIFTEDNVNNARIIELINGDFSCILYKDSTAYKYAPQADRITKSVCAIGIPPNGLGFSGMLLLYLKTQPTKDEKEQLFFFSRELSRIITDDNIRQGSILPR